MDDQQARDLLSVPEDPFVDDDDNTTNSSDQNTTRSALTGFLNRNRRRLNQIRNSRLATESTAGSSSRNSQAFNLRAEAAEFVPSVSSRMPTKRKASSSARSGKSTVASPRSHQATPDQPIIRAEELFGRDALTQKDAETVSSFPAEDDDHSDILEMDMNDFRILGQNQQPLHRRETLREALAVARSRSADQAKRPAEAHQASSAILFSCDNVTGSSDQMGSSTRLRYLPLGPITSTAGRGGTITKDASLTILPGYRQRIDSNAAKQTTAKRKWLSNQLPKELFDLITDYLSRDDIKSMRLVCTEFEQKVSDTLFNTSVVPFNTELYDMIDEDAKASTRSFQPSSRSRAKGKGRARDAPQVNLDSDHTGLHWQNDKEDAEGKVYRGHGLRVFQGFGPHIKRFGMSFEVAEGQLARPPIKRELDHVESYHGAYDWPPQQYTRFAGLAGLERTADETLRMKAAFANLTKVQELGLCVESGLGWLNGPDKSVFARIFERPSPVFGQSHSQPSEAMQEAKDFWAALRTCHRKAGVVGNPKEISLARKTKPLSELSGLQGTRFADTRDWPSISAANIKAAAPPVGLNEGDGAKQGVLFSVLHLPGSDPPVMDKSALVPNDLRKEQKEWLLETEWAQRAFLESYLLAIIDNPLVVANVRTLNIAKVSSSFLPIIGRQSFWDALPNLTDVTIHVKPDWRTVEKDNAGFAETHDHHPSEAARLFHKVVLRDRICLRPSITKLNIGWVGGGEHAEGIFARNSNILPAPISQPEHSTMPTAGFGLVFKFVEHLTLYNCWITPPALEELVRSHSDKALKKLTLDSVSLTAHPRFPAGGQQAQAIAQMQANGAIVHHWPAPVQHNPHFPQPNAAAMQNVWPALNINPAPQAGQFQQQMFNQLFNNNNNNQNNANAGFPPPPGLPAGNPAPNAQPLFGAPHIGMGNNMQQGPAFQPFTNNDVQQNLHWSSSMREGSWPELLNKISPGPVFSDYLPQPQPWEEQPPPRPETTLQSIELKSCGYVRLTNNNTFDQFAITATDDHHLSVWFRARQSALAPAMMCTSDRCLGKIVQHIPNRELVAMLLAWQIREGWEDREKAEEAEYDGWLPGGTGRLTGTIYKDMPLVSTPGAA